MTPIPNQGREGGREVQPRNTAPYSPTTPSSCSHRAWFCIPIVTSRKASADPIVQKLGLLESSVPLGKTVPWNLLHIGLLGAGSTKLVPLRPGGSARLGAGMCSAVSGWATILWGSHPIL